MPNAQQNQSQSSQKASPANQDNSGKVGFGNDKAKPIAEKNAMLDHEKFIRKLYTYGEGDQMDVEKFVSMFSDEGYMLDMASGTKFRGKAIGDSIAGLASAFPDLHRELLSIYVAENVVVVEIAIRGTHKGELALASGTLEHLTKRLNRLWIHMTARIRFNIPTGTRGPVMNGEALFR